MLGDVRASRGGQGLKERVAACAVLALVALAGCGSLEQGHDAGRARPETYVVRAGDTLFSIAARFHLDHHDVARWNHLGDGSLIYPGQRLRLSAPGAQASGAPSAAVPAILPPPGQWQWPAEGTVVLGFRQSPKTMSGILIGGHAGEPVVAAADGEVVYSGSGLTGYGPLVIIRHNTAWLSAYGHNDHLLVREGERVVAGQEIATMGSGAGLPAALHFEIRQEGEPVDPLRFLPARR